ncbi:MAG: hypothetical protein ACT4NJ_03450, partial [Nitrosopumilaceae archaeon]
MMSRRKKRRYPFLLPTGNIKKITSSKISEISQKLMEGPRYKKYGLLYKNQKYGLMYKDFFEESKKFYKKGDVIDAFVILHGLIHAALEVAWSDFRLSITGSEDFVEAEQDWNY